MTNAFTLKAYDAVILKVQGSLQETTAPPTTAGPTTVPPTTAGPTTVPPTTVSPTSPAPATTDAGTTLVSSFVLLASSFILYRLF